MDQHRPWGTRVAAEIGQRVAMYRDLRGISAQQLAEECARLGMPSISRTVITKLENGRRDSVSTAELQVLAQALGVPAVLLLFPLGRADTVEVLPGLEVGPDAAIEWFIGNSGDPADPAAPPQLGDENPMALWAEHLRIEDSIAKMDAYRASAIDPAQLGEGTRNPLVTPGIFVENIAVLTASLLRVRQAMRSLGLAPPPLDPRTALIVLARADLAELRGAEMADLQAIRDMAKGALDDEDLLRSLNVKVHRAGDPAADEGLEAAHGQHR